MIRTTRTTFGRSRCGSHEKRRSRRATRGTSEEFEERDRAPSEDDGARHERHLGADGSPAFRRQGTPGRTLDVSVLWVRWSDEGPFGLAGVPRPRHAQVRRVERDLGVHLLAPRLAATKRRARTRAPRADRTGTGVDGRTLGGWSAYARRTSHSTTATTPMMARIVMTIPMVFSSFVATSAAPRGFTS